MAMAISMYSASVPIFVRMLKNLSHCIDKAAAYAEAKKFEPAVLVESRLAPDMLPFRTQVQIACDAAKFGVARLAGTEAPKFADDETTFDALKARIAKTIDFLQSVPAASVDGSEGKPISVPRRNSEPMQFTGENYLRHLALPNFFFHVTTAYALLRHNGVDIGKSDFLGG
jgi:hypothetical protein